MRLEIPDQEPRASPVALPRDVEWDMASRSFGLARASGMAWCLLLSLTTSSSAADPSPASERQTGNEARLTLSQARARAREASPELSVAREAVAAARGEERQAGAFLNPSVGWFREETSQGGDTNNQDIVLLEQPLEIAGQRGLRRAAAGSRRAAAEARLAVAELDLDLEVARAFARTLAAERKAARASEAAEAFARARRISERRRERGDISGYEARRTALEAARYAALAAAAERDVRKARARLRSLISASADSHAPLPALPDTFPAQPDGPGDLAALRNRALAQHPAIRSAELTRDALDARARLARREIVPDPTIGLGYKREAVAGSSGSWDGYAAQVTLPIPLWDRSGGAVDAAEAEARAATARLRRTRRRIAFEVERAWHDLRAASRQLEVIRPQLGPDARAALAAASTAYEEGEIALVEWLDAVRAYYEAETTYAGLLADHLIRRAALERAVGGPLE